VSEYIASGIWQLTHVIESFSTFPRQDNGAQTIVRSPVATIRSEPPARLHIQNEAWCSFWHLPWALPLDASNQVREWGMRYACTIIERVGKLDRACLERGGGGGCGMRAERSSTSSAAEGRWRAARDCCTAPRNSPMLQCLVRKLATHL
jgi:hypothetical protein